MVPEKKKLSIGKKLIFTLLLIGIFILPFEVIDQQASKVFFQ